MKKLQKMEPVSYAKMDSEIQLMVVYKLIYPTVYHISPTPSFVMSAKMAIK